MKHFPIMQGGALPGPNDLKSIPWDMTGEGATLYHSWIKAQDAFGKFIVGTMPDTKTEAEVFMMCAGGVVRAVRHANGRHSVVWKDRPR